MTGREWGWRPAQAEGIWRHGARWTKPLFAAAPWITLALLLVMFCLLGNRLTVAPGVVFDLPTELVGQQAIDTTMTMLVQPSANVGENGGTLVFFDDARYVLWNRRETTSSAELQRYKLSDQSEQLRARIQDSSASGALLMLVDRRVASGDLHKIVKIARDAGVRHVQIANWDEKGKEDRRE